MDGTTRQGIRTALRVPAVTAENMANDEARSACNTVIDQRHRAASWSRC
ncbi:hypothetical protein EDD90_5079 [Streptomyces sp. Ag109_O5-1]|nr:hypothetical protein [Streptomyces sp. Ag109_O5-1]RPE41978.1 hypothetical protein EDD90_5079 [Streptomyces sp. Ag109_O5-1]